MVLLLSYILILKCQVSQIKWEENNIFLVEEKKTFLIVLISSNNVFFYLGKFISYWIMYLQDPNGGNMNFNCSNVSEVVSGLLRIRRLYNKDQEVIFSDMIIEPLQKTFWL